MENGIFAQLKNVESWKFISLLEGSHLFGNCFLLLSLKENFPISYFYSSMIFTIFSYQYSFAGIAKIKEMMPCKNSKAKVSFWTFFYSKYCHCLKISFVGNSVKVTSGNRYFSPLIHLWWSSLLLTISTSSLVSSCCNKKILIYHKSYKKMKNKLKKCIWHLARICARVTLEQANKKAEIFILTEA